MNILNLIFIKKLFGGYCKSKSPMFYEIRGTSNVGSLAILYGCVNGTKINLAVKRHMNRFPDRVVFN